MSRHELRPHIHSACAHFKCCLKSKEALEPSLEGARSSASAMGQRARLSMLTCALAVTLPLIALSFTAPARADVLLRPPASMTEPAQVSMNEPAQAAMTEPTTTPTTSAAATVTTLSESAPAAPRSTGALPASAPSVPASAPSASASSASSVPSSASGDAAAAFEAQVPTLELTDAIPDAAWLGPSALIKRGLSSLQWSQVSAQAQAELQRNQLDGFVYSPRIAAIFARHGIDGSFIAQRLGTNYLFGYNFLLAQYEFAPDATFNFVSAYLSLALQAVPDIDVKFLNYRTIASAPGYSMPSDPTAQFDVVGSQLKAEPHRTDAPLELEAKGQAYGHAGFNMGRAWQHSLPAVGVAHVTGAQPAAATPAPAAVPGRNESYGRTEAQSQNEALSSHDGSAHGTQLTSEEQRKVDSAFRALYPVYPYDSDTSMRVAFTSGNAKINSYWAELVESSRIQQALELLGLSKTGLVITDANKRTFWQDRSLQYSLITEVAFLNRLAQCSLTGSSLQHGTNTYELGADAPIAQMMTWAQTGTLVDHALIAAQTRHKQPGAAAAQPKDSVLKVPGLSSAANAPSDRGLPPVLSNLSAVQQRHQDICNQVLDVAVVAVFDQQGNVVRLSNGRGDNDLNHFSKYYVLYGKSNVIDSSSALFPQQIYRYAGLISDEQGHIVSFALAVPLGPNFSAHHGAQLLNEILQETLLLPRSHDLSIGLALQEHKDEIPQELYGSNFGSKNVFSAAGETNVSLLKMPLTNFGVSAEQLSALNGVYQRNRNLTQVRVAQKAMLDAMGPDLQQLARQDDHIVSHVLTEFVTPEQAYVEDGSHHRFEESSTMMPRRPALDGRTGAASKNTEAQLDLSQITTQAQANDYNAYRQGVINDLNSSRYPHSQDSDDIMSMLEDEHHGLEGKEVWHDLAGETAGSVRRSVFAHSVMDKAQARVAQAQAGVSADLIEQQVNDKRQAFFDVIGEISHQETPISALERQRMVRASTEVAQSASIMSDIAEQHRAQRELAHESGSQSSKQTGEAEGPMMVDDRYRKCPPEEELLQLNERELHERGLEDCLKMRRNASTSSYPAVSYNEGAAGQSYLGRESG